MLFGKRAREKEPEKSCESTPFYYDSLTGLMNKSFAVKEYERVKNKEGYGAVIVRLIGLGDMPYYKAERCIMEAGGVIARICDKEISRVENGDFIVFSNEYEADEEKLSFFLRELSNDEQAYVAANNALDPAENFEQLFRRLKRHVVAVELELAVKLAIK